MSVHPFEYPEGLADEPARERIEQAAVDLVLNRLRGGVEQVLVDLCLWAANRGAENERARLLRAVEGLPQKLRHCEAGPHLVRADVLRILAGAS